MCCAVVSVCSARDGDVHAGQVSAGLHVPSKRSHSTCSSLHVHTDLLSIWAVYHQRDRVHLHHLSTHGRNLPTSASMRVSSWQRRCAVVVWSAERPWEF